MESCEPPAALNVLPWPGVALKNRVGGSPAFSFVFAFQYIGETLDTPAENGSCGYDFASGVHKYLYAEDDPANLDDPSGHDAGETVETLNDDNFSGTVPGLSIISKGAQGLLAQEAPTRPLTSGEINLAQTVFGGTINYSITCIHLGKYSGFISKDTFVTPDGTMYMDPSAEAYSSLCYREGVCHGFSGECQ